RHTDTSYLQQLLRAGVDGYVLKQSDADELLRAIRSVVKSGKYLDPALSEKVMGTYVGRLNVRNTSRLGEVTEREEEILRFIAQGYSNKDIATRLDVSVKTVEAHKANAMNKLDLHSRVEIIRFAMLQGWLQDS
ncbi:MAG TPA: response regulator transcription factor, partial [Blastocatellia bacterium]|nr:response regulator transcription factor [Blastocatellia bacterium]